MDDLVLAGDVEGLGVEDIFYSVDGAGFATYGAAFQIAQEGSREVDFYAVDIVTNTEPVDSQVFLVDNTTPVSGIGFSEPRRGGRRNAGSGQRELGDSDIRGSSDKWRSQRVGHIIFDG